jgi:hypothetical protein
MAHAVRAVRKASVSTLPRGVVVTALALMSWGLVLAGWKAVTVSFNLLLGA